MTKTAAVHSTLDIPNKTTMKAIKEIESGKKLKKFSTVDQLISDLNK